MIDKTIPHVAVLLVKNDPTDYPRYSLPEGYSFESFRPGREDDWVRIHLDSELIDGEEAARNTLEREFKVDPEGMTKRMWFVIDPSGRAVGTISMWPGGAFGPDYERVHWVAVEKSQQGKGLSNAMMTKALDVYNEVNEGRPLFVHTQTWSYLAVSLYEKFGFVPYMGPKPMNWSAEADFEADSVKGWAIIREMQAKLKK